MSTGTDTGDDQNVSTPLDEAAGPGDGAGETSTAESGYWRENVRLLVTLMAIWFVSSFGAGILFRDFLDQFMIGGYPLGFWFAQQGSIYVFIVLIYVYAKWMDRIDARFGVD